MTNRGNTEGQAAKEKCQVGGMEVCPSRESVCRQSRPDVRSAERLSSHMDQPHRSPPVHRPTRHKTPVGNRCAGSEISRGEGVWNKKGWRVRRTCHAP